MPALVHDVCWLVRGIDPLHQGVGSSGSGSSGSSSEASGDNDNSSASVSGSSGSSRPRFVCWKDPVDFRSHPVSVLVTTIIDRLVQPDIRNTTYDFHTLSIHLLHTPL